MSFIGFAILLVVESRKVFHPCVLTEPCVTVSFHTALPVLNHKCIATLWMYQLPVWESAVQRLIIFISEMVLGKRSPSRQKNLQPDGVG